MQLLSEQTREATCRIVSRGYSNPTPTIDEIVNDIAHKNDEDKDKGKLFDFVRGIQSTEMHSHTKLKCRLGNPPPRYPFPRAWPDLSPAFGGPTALSDAQWQHLHKPEDEGGIVVENKAEYLTHILTKHDGEAVSTGEIRWTVFSAGQYNIVCRAFGTTSGAGFQKHASGCIIGRWIPQQKTRTLKPGHALDNVQRRE